MKSAVEKQITDKKLTTAAALLLLLLDIFCHTALSITTNQLRRLLGSMNESFTFLMQLTLWEEDPFAFAASSKMITPEELSHRSAASSSAAADTQLWLSLLGHVFDVTQGQTHYGPSGAYSFFTGRDASAAFITGQFTEEGLKEEADEVLTPQQLLELVEGWLQFYKDRYPLVGRLVGRFYTEQGKPTDALERVRQSLQAGRQLKQQEQAEREALPPCNRRWSQDEGAVVWCSKSSGGVRRDWEGVPRQYYGVASQADGKVTKKCVCVQERGESEHDPNLRVYPGCDPSASLCKVESKS
ncbi:Neuferricin [Balamuthia mandrillaris]